MRFESDAKRLLNKVDALESNSGKLCKNAYHLEFDKSNRYADLDQMMNLFPF